MIVLNVQKDFLLKNSKNKTKSADIKPYVIEVIFLTSPASTQPYNFRDFFIGKNLLNFRAFLGKIRTSVKNKGILPSRVSLYVARGNFLHFCDFKHL